MAIDTAHRRFSIMLDYGSMPPPDGSLTAPDRLFMLEFYSGISASNQALFANLWYTLGNERTEFTLPRAPELTTDDNRTEFTLEDS